LAGCLAFALALALRPIAHDDLFGHLRTGAWMLQHRGVPRVDVFSFTRFGARWVTHEWGFSLAAYGVYRLAGFAGLLALTAVLTVVILGALAWRARALAGEGPRAGEWPILLGLLALGLWAVSRELFLRAA